MKIQDRMLALRDRIGEASEAELAAFEKSRAEVAEINKSISRAIEQDATKPVQLSWLPTKTARVSFFRPIADQKLQSLHTDITHKSAWGSLQVFGPALNIVDEGIFLAILICIRAQREPTIRLNFSHICRLLGISVHTKNRNRIKKGIKKLSKTSFDFELKDGTWTVKHILADASGNNNMTIITLDPWFYDHFLANEITLINLKFRQSLRGDITKALYRFLVSHRGPQKYYLQTLIEALNLDTERELKQNRRAMKSAFGQLRNKGFLSFKFRKNLFFDIRILDKKLLEK